MNEHSLPKVLLIGGPDVSTRLELMRLLSSQYQVQIAGSASNLAEAFEREGFKYHYYSLGKKVNPFSYLVSLLELISIVHKEHPDIVHTFDTKPSIVGRLAAKLNRVPVVIGTITGLGSLYIIHGKLLLYLVRFVYETLQKVLCKISDLTIFYTQDDAAFFLSRKLVERNKMIVISGSGVMLDRFSLEHFSEKMNHETMAEIGIPEGYLVVTMIARLVHSKGILPFTDLARKIKSRFPETCFLLIGPHDTESFDSLSCEEVKLVCEDVKWIGNQLHVEKYLAISSVFVLPSNREGISRVLMEAGAMNLPLVATNLSGCREVVVNEKNGFLISPDDWEALEQAVTDLILHPQKRQQFGSVSRDHVMKNFDIKRIAAVLDETYQHLLIQKGVTVWTGKTSMPEFGVHMEI